MTEREAFTELQLIRQGAGGTKTLKEIIRSLSSHFEAIIAEKDKEHIANITEAQRAGYEATKERDERIKELEAQLEERGSCAECKHLFDCSVYNELYKISDKENNEMNCSCFERKEYE